MFKKIIILLIMLILFLTGCGKESTEIENNKQNENDTTKTSYTTVIALEETSEKITEKMKIEGMGEIEFIHSTTSSYETLLQGKIAKGDIIIIDDFQYVFMKKFNGEEYIDSDFFGFSVKALKQKATYTQMYDSLFNGIVIDADYCFYDNTLIESPPHMSSNIYSANHCFENCSNLKFDDIAMFLHIMPNLSETQYMFASCDGITKATMYQGNIVNTTGMFKNCKNLTSFETISDKVEIVDNMFENCINLNGNIFLGSGIKSYKDIFKNTQQEIVLMGNIQENILKEYNNVN